MVAVLALLPVGSALAALFGERTGYHIPLLCFGHFVARFVRDSACCLFSRIFESRTAAADTRATVEFAFGSYNVKQKCIN